MELYVIATVDSDGNITGFPKDGTTFLPPYIRAFETEEGARQAKKRQSYKTEVRDAKVVRILDAEVI